MGTNIDRIDVAIVVCIHVAIREETIGEQREQDELWQSEKLVA